MQTTDTDGFECLKCKAKHDEFEVGCSACLSKWFLKLVEIDSKSN